jgi:hypothetical protein
MLVTSDNVLIAITGNQGDGIAIVDLPSLPARAPIPGRAASTSNSWKLAAGSHSSVDA